MSDNIKLKEITMLKLTKMVALLVVSMLLSACTVTPPGWSVSCGMPMGSSESNDGIYTMTLDGDERDYCHHSSTNLGRHKQRAEIQKAVTLNRLYQLDYEFKYSGSGGSTIMQLHPGRPSSVRADIWSECDQLSIVAGYQKIRFNLPGQIEMYPVSEKDYQDKWHKVSFIFRASNDAPLYKLYFNGEVIYDSSQSSAPIDLCYYDREDPSVHLGLYRGKRDVFESISVKNIKLKEIEL